MWVKLRDPYKLEPSFSAVGTAMSGRVLKAAGFIEGTDSEIMVFFIVINMWSESENYKSRRINRIYFCFIILDTKICVKWNMLPRLIMENDNKFSR